MFPKAGVKCQGLICLGPSHSRQLPGTWHPLFILRVVNPQQDSTQPFKAELGQVHAGKNSLQAWLQAWVPVTRIPGRILWFDIFHGSLWWIIIWPVFPQTLQGAPVDAAHKLLHHTKAIILEGSLESLYITPKFIYKKDCTEGKKTRISTWKMDA